MAKGAHKRKEKESSAGTGSLLELAFSHYEAGDALSARRFAKKLLEAPASPADEAAVKKIAAELIAPPEGHGAPTPPTPTAHELAKLIIGHTRVPPRAYAFAALAASLWLGMIGLALTRS